MKLDFKNKFKNKKRVGRGTASGSGKTAGRGTKGQKSRSGFKHKRGFEGGQNPLSQRIPKLKGFKSLGIKYNIINVESLNIFKDGETVNYKNLKEKKIIIKKGPIKILGRGELKKKIIVEADAFSKKACEIIKKAGGEYKKLKPEPIKQGK